MHFVSRATPINRFVGKSHKLELKSSRNYLQDPNYAIQPSNAWPWQHIYIIYIHAHIKVPQESDVKKPGAHWPVAITRLV